MVFIILLGADNATAAFRGLAGEEYAPKTEIQKLARTGLDTIYCCYGSYFFAWFFSRFY